MLTKTVILEFVATVLKSWNDYYPNLYLFSQEYIISYLISHYI